MRRGIIFLGFSLIVLMLVAGCASTQTPATGSKSQSPPEGYTATKTTQANSLTKIINCDRPPIDPVRFYKYLPDVQGYERKWKQNMRYVKFN